MERRGFIGAIIGAVAALCGGKAVAVAPIEAAAVYDTPDWCCNWSASTEAGIRTIEVGNMVFYFNESDAPAIVGDNVRLFPGERFVVTRYP